MSWYPRVDMRLIMLFALSAIAVNAQSPPSPVKAAPLLTKDLPGVPGKEAMMLTVEYAPGASSPVHRHNASVFVYVLEGSVVMQVKGGQELSLGPGETFYETPDDIHSVSRNASTTKPAKIVVFLVKDKGAPVSMPAH